MTRSYAAILLIFVTSSITGCGRPSESDCRKAIENIRRLAGTENDDFGDPASAIRSCRGNASKKSVNCVVNARNPADLEACEGGIFDEMFKEEIESAKQSDEAKPDEAKPDEAKPDEAKPDEAKTPAPAKPDEAKTPAPAKPDEAKTPAPAKPDPAKAPAPAKPDEAKTPAPAKPDPAKAPAPAKPDPAKPATPPSN